MVLLQLIRLELTIWIHLDPIYDLSCVKVTDGVSLMHPIAYMTGAGLLQWIIGRRHFLRIVLLILNTYGG